MNELLIAIPTINRDTLDRAIRSIDYPCDVIILVDGSVSNKDYMKIISKYEDENTSVLRSNVNSVRTKNLAIDYLKQNPGYKFFCFLDDDDRFVEGYLDEAIHLFKTNDIGWVTAKWSYDIPEPEDHSNPHKLIAPSELDKYYFKWDEYYSHEVDSLIPNSLMMYNVGALLLLIRDGDFIIHDCADDIYPTMRMMTSYQGAYYLRPGHIISRTENSVSRKVVEYDEAHKQVIDSLLTEYLNSGKEVWKNAAINAASIWNYNNIKYNE